MLDSIRDQRYGWLAKALAYCITATLVVPVVPASYAAGIVTDPNAEVRFQPQVNVHNSVPVVNIVTPDNTGLSHNQYEQFNIGKNGAVLNNSLVSGSSRLAAEIIANPNLNGVAASTILNEVTSSSNTNMLGALEVFGQSANVIIANRNGITCNDCGFINTDRVTLTTGAPHYIGNSLFFDITDGAVTFTGEGVDHKLSPEVLDIFARYIDVNGEVQSSQQLNLISGALSLNYTDLLSGELDITPLAADTDQQRTYAIDASIFGAMQSGKISVMATEEGLGVRSDSYLFSQSDSLFIESAGDIALRDADSFTGMDIRSSSDVHISDDLIANTQIRTQSGSFANVSNSEITADLVDLSATDSITLHGEVNSRSTHIDSNSANIHADLISMEDISIDTSALSLNDNEVVADNIALSAKQSSINDALLSARDIELDSQRSLDINDSTFAAEQLAIDSAQLDLTNSQLQSNQITIDSQQVNATGVELSAADIRVDASSILLSDVFTHSDKLQVNSDELSVLSSQWVVKDLAIDSDSMLSKDSQYQAESAQLDADSARLIGDQWQILSFASDADTNSISEGSTATETFSAKVDDLEVVNSVLVARDIELTGKEVALRGSDLQAERLQIKAPQALLDANSKARISDTINIDGSEVFFAADTDARQIDIDGKTVTIGGNIAVAEDFNIDSQTLNLTQANINADKLALRTDQLSAEFASIISRVFNASVTDVISTDTLNLQSDYIVLNARQVLFGDKTELSSKRLAVEAQTLNNLGDVRTSDTAELNIDQAFNNTGKLISYQNLTINADSINNQQGATISATQASMTASQFNNQGQVGADYLVLDYDKIYNAAGATLSAADVSLTAASEQSRFNNAGTVSVGQRMGWDNAEFTAGTFINGGTLDARNLDVTGLNQFFNSDPNKTSHAGRISIANELSGNVEYFYQAGQLNAEKLQLQANSLENLGTIQASITNLDVSGHIKNGGRINSESLVLRSAGLENQKDGQLSGQNLVLRANELSNHGTIGAFNLELLTEAANGTLVNNGSIVQRNEYAGQQQVDGQLAISHFAQVDNDGSIEADDKIRIAEVARLNNALNNADAVMISADNISADAVASINNAGLLVGEHFEINAGQLSNTGKISLTSADMAITGTLENDGILYQRDEAADNAQVNLNAATFINGENAATDVIRGVIDLSSGNPGTLVNKGLLAERKDAANSGLAMRGIGSLQNSGQISLSSELAMSGGDFHNQGVDAYIGVGVLRLEALQSLQNDGSMVFDGDSVMAARQFINQGTIASTDQNPQTTLALDAEQLQNVGRISTSAELALNQAVSGRINNSGLLYGGEVSLGNAHQRQQAVVNSGVNSVDGNGDLVAAGIQSGQGDVSIVTQSFANHQQTQAGQVTSAGQMSIDASQAVELRGKLEAASAMALSMAALDVDSAASVRSAAGNSTVTVAGHANIDGQLLLSDSSRLTLGSLSNQGHIQGKQLAVVSSGQLTNSGKLITDSASVSAAQINNSGQLHANQQLTAQARHISNSGQLTSAQAMSLFAQGGSVSNSGRINAVELTASTDRIQTSAGSLINAQRAQLQAQKIDNQGTLNQANGSGEFVLTAASINNLGANAVMDISRGRLNASDLVNEGTIVSESGSDSGQLLISPLQSLNNSGQLFAHSDISVAQQLDNSGQMQINNLTANTLSDFANSGDMRASERIELASQQALNNDGKILASELQLTSARQIINAGLLRADKELLIDAQSIDNGQDAEMSTSNDQARMQLSSRQATVNAGNIIAKGDIDMDVAHFENRGNMTATQTGTLKLDSLNNGGYIFGKDLIVGSNTQYISEQGLAGSQGASGSGSVTGLVADNSLTMFVRGLLQASYQSKLINLNSDQDLQIAGSILADDVLNIDAKGLTVQDTGLISINGGQPESIWKLDGDLVNQGSITSMAGLNITAKQLNNEANFATNGLLDITVDGLTNLEAGVLSGGGGLSIKGHGGQLQALSNSGSLVSGDYLDISATDIENEGKISSRGGVWNFANLDNEQGGKIYSLGDTRWGSAAERLGSFDNKGAVVLGAADIYVSDFTNHEGSQLVSIDGLLTLDSAASIRNEKGSIIAANQDLVATSAGQLWNFGGIKSNGSATLNASTLMNGSLDERANGLIDVAGVLDINAGLVRNDGWTTSSGSKKLAYKINTYSFYYRTKTTKDKLGRKDDDYYLHHTVGVDYGYSETKAVRSGIYSGGNLTINGRLENNLSYVASGDVVTINGSGYNSSDTIDVNRRTLEFISKKQEKPKGEARDYFYQLAADFRSSDQQVKDQAYANLDNRHVMVGSTGNILFKDYKYPASSAPIGHAKVINASTGKMDNPHVVGIIYGANGTNITGSGFENYGFANTKEFNINGIVDGSDADAASDTDVTQLAQQQDQDNQDAGDLATNGSGYQGSDAATGGQDVAVQDVDQTQVPDGVSKGSFSNQVSGPNLLGLEKNPSAALLLLQASGIDFDYQDLNALAVGGDKSPLELAGEEALNDALAQLGNRTHDNTSSMAIGQGSAFGNTTATLYDLPEDIRDIVFASYGISANPRSALEQIDQAKRPDVSAQYFYNPIEEAQLLRDVAMRESGKTYFSDDWRSAQQQRDVMFSNSLAYLENHDNVKLGEALTQEQIASLESPLLWYVSKNIGGEEKLVPAVYLPEATMAQMTTPEAGTINATTLIADVDDFTNSGVINVKEHASIKANTFTNQRVTDSVETDRYAHTSVSDAGAINAGSLIVETTEDINNIGGSIKTDGYLELNAGGDVNLTAIETRDYQQFGKNIDEKNGYVTSTIEAGGNANFIADGDINSQAAQVTVEGDLGLEAENINLLGVTEREYQQRYKKKNGTFSSSETTEQWETQTFKGTGFDVGGNSTMIARNDINMVGTTIEGDGDIRLKAGNDVNITAGINQESYSKEKSGEGIATTNSQQKGHIKQTAVGSNLTAGGYLTIDSDGGDVSILGSTLRAEKDLLLGDLKIRVDENNQPILDENGQYITEDGESIANLTIGSVELTDEEWNEKQSGLKGPLKKLAQVAAFTLSSMGVTQQLQALGIDTEVTVSRSESERTETVHHVGSKTTAGGTLVAIVDEHVQVDGSELGADQGGKIQSKTSSYDATVDTTTHTKQRSEETVSADEMALSKDEVTIASATHTDHTETETTVTQTANRTQLNFASFSSNTVGDTEFNGVLADIKGDANITGGKVTFGSASTTDSKVSEEETVETSYTVGVRNAYVDAAYAAEAVVKASDAVENAKRALDDAKKRVHEGTLAKSALDDYRANLAAASAQLTNATIALGAAGVTAAGSSGTAGFYASAGVNRSESSKQSSESSTTQHGSEFKVGGNASVGARDGGAIDIIGSSLDVGGQLSLDADDVNILASADERSSASSEQESSVGFSVSTSGAKGYSAAQQMAAASGSANASMQNSDSSSYSKTYNNSSIKAGSFSSTSKNLHLAGANVEITGDIDITTDNLIVESLQNESRSSHSSEGHGMGISSSGSLTGSYNTLDGSSERAWVDSRHPYENSKSSAEGGPQKFGGQTTLIGGGNVNIDAKNTEVHGAVVANAVRNEDGSLTDLGNLNLITDELIVTDLKDTDVSESSGFNVSTTVGFEGDDAKTEDDESYLTGSTSAGVINQGHRKEQTTAGTLGGGSITRRDGSEHELGDTNRDLDQRQVVTLDQQTGGLNASVTVDHRLLSEQGQEDIVNDLQDTYEHGEDIGRAANDVVTDERSSLLDFGSNVHNNTLLTELKNELVRDPAYQWVLAGLSSKDPEQYQQAMQVVGQLAQDKFGLNPTDIQFYDGGETTSSSLADVDGLTDRKGGTVTAANHAESGNIFIDGGDGASKTDMANTLGHEVLESQMQQGQGGGLFGTPSGEAKDALADALGAQMQDRMNQAVGGNLDSTGGADFSAALASSAGVRAGTERANNVGGAAVENRQLYTEEGEWLQGQVTNYAAEKGISKEQAQRDLTQAALRSSDSTHNHQLRETDDNYEALEWLSDQADSNPDMPSELASLVRLENDIDGNTSHAEKTEIRREGGYYNREQNAETWQDPSLAPMYESAIDADLSNGPTSVMRDKRAEEICGPEGCMNPTLAGAIAGFANETVLMGVIDPDNIQDPDAKEAFETASDITTAAGMVTLVGAAKNAVEMMVKKSDDIVDAVDSNKIREVTENLGDKGLDGTPSTPNINTTAGNNSTNLGNQSGATDSKTPGHYLEDFEPSQTPAQLVNNANGTTTNIRYDHILDGNVNGRGVGSGGHYVRSDNINITEYTKPTDANGVRTGYIQVRDPNTGGWVNKPTETTFYPDHWSRRQTVQEIQGAFENSSPVTLPNGKLGWQGVSPSGVKVQGYYTKPEGSGATAWPVYGD